MAASNYEKSMRFLQPYIDEMYRQGLSPKNFGFEDEDEMREYVRVMPVWSYVDLLHDMEDVLGVEFN